MIEKIKEHWLVTLVIICAAVVAATWAVAKQTRIEPLELENTRLQQRIEEIQSDQHVSEASAVLARTSLSAGQTSATTDGACTIGLEQVRADTAYITLVAGTKPLSRFRMIAGENLQTSVPGAWYYFFVLDVRDGVATVSGHRIGEPTGL